MKRSDYLEKLARMAERTLLPLLDANDRAFAQGIAVEHRLTFQELRTVAEAARDLRMWREEPLAQWWRRAASALEESDPRERKTVLFRLLGQHLRSLAASDKEYPTRALRGSPRRRVRPVEDRTPRTVFGRCAAYSERTLCCRLYTVDAVLGCPFGCSYCTIQTFYGGTAALQADLAEKLRRIRLDPDRFYHLGTGQSSDSLVWGNRAGILDALLDFAARHPNVLLELKTKSDNVGDLLGRDLPENALCSWSLNSHVIITNEEHGTASLDRRLRAARAVADRHRRVGFHFHPMIRYRGWRSDYGAVAARLLAGFSPREVAFVSIGSLTLIRPAVREIRRRGGETKVLQMETSFDPHGKLTYPEETKIELFRFLYRALRPWHEEVFFYLCMETPPVWEAVLGHSYPGNEAFDADFARRCGAEALPRLPGAETTPIHTGALR